MNPQCNPTIITTNIPNWLHNRYMRMWSYYIITPIGNYYVVNGKRIEAKEFELMYPIDSLEIV